MIRTGVDWLGNVVKINVLLKYKEIQGEDSAWIRTYNGQKGQGLGYEVDEQVLSKYWSWWKMGNNHSTRRPARPLCSS